MITATTAAAAGGSAIIFLTITTIKYQWRENSMGAFLLDELKIYSNRKAYSAPVHALRACVCISCGKQSRGETSGRNR